MELGLKGRRALVTAASRGLGRASALSLAAEGARVAVAGRNLAAMQDFLTELKQAGAADVLAVPMDLTDRTTLTPAVDEVVAKFGGLDIFVGNTGGPAAGPFLSVPREGWEQALNESLLPLVDLSHAVLPHMIAQKSGDVVFTSSVAGVVPVVWEPIYTASKFAVQAFVHSTRRQISKHGVRVGAVLPGPVVTALLDDWPKAKMEEALANGSLMQPKEVAECVLFMLTRPRNVVVRDLVILPNSVDL